MYRFAIGGSPGGEFNDTSHLGPFLKVSFERRPQLTVPPWKVTHWVSGCNFSWHILYPIIVCLCKKIYLYQISAILTGTRCKKSKKTFLPKIVFFLLINLTRVNWVRSLIGLVTNWLTNNADPWLMWFWLRNRPIQMMFLRMFKITLNMFWRELCDSW